MKSITHLTFALGALLFLAPLPSSTAQGRVVLDSVMGFSLEGNLAGESPERTVAVYLPESYDASPGRRYPVLYLLHGIGGTHGDWTTPQASGSYSTLQDVMDRGVKAGTQAELIVVMPNQMTRLGGSFYSNSSATGGWEDFTVIDLVGHVDSTYRTLEQASSRGIAGHSMGGYGALKLGMKHPEVYQVVYGMNAALLGWAGDLLGDNPAYAKAAVATPSSLNPRVDFYPVSLLCVAQAFSPNPALAPFYAELPFGERDGQVHKLEPGYSNWTKNMPLYMVEDYADNLRSLRALRFDSGRDDEYTHIPPTNLALSKRLDELGVKHSFEDYNGDHRNRLWGSEGRVATQVLPFFGRLLSAE